MGNYNENIKLLDACGQRLKKIKDYFINKTDYTGDSGLYTGDSGVALLFAQCYLWEKDERLLDKIDEHIATISKTIYSETYPLATFCSGIAGFGWLISYLSDKKIIDISTDYFDEFDHFLRGMMHYLHQSEKLDQLHGMIGIARYFIKRGLKDDIAFALNTIAGQIEQDGSEYRWIRKDQIPFSYDFGLAHGMAGLLHFLGKCHQLGVEPKVCEKIGNGIVEFYNNNEGCNPKEPFYPNFILQSEYRQARNLQGTRLAWCYGDLSVLLPMYQYAVRVRNTGMQQTTLKKLIKVSERKNLIDNRISDAIICHGSSGLAIMYSRLFRDTCREEFRDTARYWAGVTVAMGNQDDSPTGYLFAPNSEDKTASRPEHRESLLEGTCGVGLACLSMLDPQNTDWDECLMLS